MVFIFVLGMGLLIQTICTLLIIKYMMEITEKSIKAYLQTWKAGLMKGFRGGKEPSIASQFIDGAKAIVELKKEGVNIREILFGEPEPEPLPKKE